MANKQEVVRQYEQTLLGLRLYLKELNTDEPTEAVTIIPGTEGPGRPLGAKLPVFPQEKCGTYEEGMKHALFNLRSLTGFIPPAKK